MVRRHAMGPIIRGNRERDVRGPRTVLNVSTFMAVIAASVAASDDVVVSVASATRFERPSRRPKFTPLTVSPPRETSTARSVIGGRQPPWRHDAHRVVARLAERREAVAAVAAGARRGDDRRLRR